MIILLFFLLFMSGCSFDFFGLDVRHRQLNRKCPPTWDEYKKDVNENGWINGCGYYFGNGILAYESDVNK